MAACSAAHCCSSREIGPASFATKYWTRRWPEVDVQNEHGESVIEIECDTHAPSSSTATTTTCSNAAAGGADSHGWSWKSCVEILKEEF